MVKFGKCHSKTDRRVGENVLLKSHLNSRVGRFFQKIGISLVKLRWMTNSNAEFPDFTEHMISPRQLFQVYSSAQCRG